LKINFLAIDFGEKQIGIAFGDSENKIAFPQKMEKNSSLIFEKINDFCQQKKINQILIGMPKLEQERTSKITKIIEKFTENLRKKIPNNIEIKFFGEFFSTAFAKRSARQIGISAKKMSHKIDSAAAAVFLQNFLDRKNLKKENNTNKNKKLDLTDKKQLKNFLKKFGVWSKKKFSQNFLIDQEILKKIVSAAKISKQDTIVEIGPGPGVLTREILPHCKKIIAVEIDKKILPALKESTYFFRDRLEIKNEHILNFQPPKEKFKLVANIPYHLTSPILRKFLIETSFLPEKIVILVQKEVAEKIHHPKKKSILQLFVTVFGTPKILQIVPAKCFFPEPKVDSAILEIIFFKNPKINISAKKFFAATKILFSAPRKKIKNIVPEYVLQKTKIDPNLRAEKLEISEIENFAKKLFFEKNSK